MALTFPKGFVSGGTGGWGDAGLSSVFTPKGSWTSTTGFVKRAITSWRENSNPLLQGVPGGGVNPTSKLMVMAISDPLAATTYSGTFDVVFGALELNGGVDKNYWSIHIWVTQGNTNSVRATLLSNYQEDITNEFPNPAVGIGLQSGQSISGTWQDGDRIVVELGFIQRSTTGGTGQIYIRSKNANPDLTVGSSSVTTRTGFMSFSPDLTLAAGDHNLVDNAKVVSSLPYTDTFHNQWHIGETGNSNQELYWPYTNNFDLLNGAGWYKYVATYTGNLYLSCTGSAAAHPRVGVWEDYTAAQLKTTAADNNAIAWALTPTDVTPLVIPVVSGKTYYIILGADFSIDFPVLYGDIKVSLSSTAPGTAPANDDCVNAEVITPEWTTGPLNTINATTEASDPLIDATAVGRTVWYKFTSAAVVNGSGVLAWTADYSVRIGIYTGSCGGPWTQVASNTLGMSGVIQWPTIAGTTYYIMVGDPASVGGSFNGEFHHLVPMTDFLVTNANEAAPDMMVASGTFPVGSDQTADSEYWTLEYQKAGESTWHLWDGTTIQNWPAGTVLADIYPNVTVYPPVHGPLFTGLCGNTNYLFRMTPNVTINSVKYSGPETDDAELSHISRAVYFPLSSMLRTWPMTADGRPRPTHYLTPPEDRDAAWYVVTEDDPPLAYPIGGGALTVSVRVKLDGLGGNVTFITSRSCQLDETTGSPPHITLPLDYAHQAYRWFGVRDYKLALDWCQDTTGQFLPADRFRLQKLFVSNFTLQPNVCYHCAYVLTQTGFDFGAGFTWNIKLYVDGVVVHSEAWAPGPNTNIANPYTNGVIIGTTPETFVEGYVSIGGIQNEDGSPSDYFTDDGGVTLSRLKIGSVNASDQNVLDDFNSCETTSTGFSEFMFGLYGIGSPLSVFLPTFPQAEPYGEGVTLIGAAQTVRSCCSCTPARGKLGPLYWLKWNRQEI